MKGLTALCLLFSILAAPALASPAAGITPCNITAQPGDLAYSTGSANVHLNTCGETLIVINNSATDVRYRLGTTSATTAVITDLLLPKATQVVLNVGRSGLWFAVISSGTGSISFVLGTSGQ